MRKKLSKSKTVQGGAIAALGTAAAAVIPLLPPQHRAIATAAVAVAAPLCKAVGMLLATIGVRRAIAANGNGR